MFSQDFPKDLKQINAYILKNYPKKDGTPGSRFIAAFKKDLEAKQRKFVVKPYLKMIRDYLAHYFKPNTLKTNLNALARYIKTEHDPKQDYDKDIDFTISKAWQDELDSTNRAKIEYNNSHPTEIDGTKLTAMVNTLYDTSTNRYERALALLLATGLRTYELLHSANVVCVKDNGEVSFNGIAKKRQESHDKIYSRPIISMKTASIKQRIIDLRKEFSHQIVVNNKGELAKNVNADLNKQFKITFPNARTPDNKQATVKILRKYYGAIAYTSFAQSGSNFNLYLQRIFGHNNVGSSFHYSVINTKESKPHSNVVLAKDAIARAAASVVPNVSRVIELKDEVKQIADEVKVAANEIKDADPQLIAAANRLASKPKQRAPRKTKEEVMIVLKNLWNDGVRAKIQLKKQGHTNDRLVTEFLRSTQNQEEKKEDDEPEPKRTKKYNLRSIKK